MGWSWRVGLALVSGSVAGLGGGVAAAMPPAKPVPAEAAADVADARPAVAASNAFGLDLYRRLAGEAPGANVFVSPYSIAAAMAMVAEGARGQTQDELAAVLRYPDAAAGARGAIEAQHPAHAALARRLRGAAGSTDAAERERVARLRRELDAANERVRKREDRDDYAGARAAAEEARRLAAEVNALQSRLDRFDLRVANAVWVDRAFGVVPAYAARLSEFYGTGGVTPLDMRGDAEGSRRTINAWVEERTERRIKDLIPAGGLTERMQMVITNAVYFRGEWDAPFRPDSTRDEAFTLAGGGSVRCRMMLDRWRGGVPYAAFGGDGSFFETPRRVPIDEAKRPATYPDDGGFTMVELPYKGRELAMVVIAPRRADGLPALEARLNADALGSWLSKFDAREVDTGVPRFKLESEFDLTEHLKALGVRRAFVAPGVAGAAEFDGIASSEDPEKRVCIGAVRHKTWVEVNEKGTEAAAATSVMMATAAAARSEPTMPFTPVFRADRPFLFLIRDVKTGLVLFVGRCVRPGP